MHELCAPIAIDIQIQGPGNFVKIPLDFDRYPGKKLKKFALPEFKSRVLAGHAKVTNPWVLGYFPWISEIQGPGGPGLGSRVTLSIGLVDKSTPMDALTFSISSNY